MGSEESKENEGAKEAEEKVAPIAEEINQEVVNTSSNASAEEPKEEEAAVETKEPEPEAQKNGTEGEATKEAAPEANAITQVQETELNAQVETEKLPQSLETKLDAETATGSENSKPDAEKVESATNDAKESPMQEVTLAESQVAP